VEDAKYPFLASSGEAVKSQKRRSKGGGKLSISPPKAFKNKKVKPSQFETVLKKEERT